MVTNQGRNISLENIYSDEEWINIFRQYDRDNDDRIPVRDFQIELEDASHGTMPLIIIERALREADGNGDHVITLDEFLDLVKKSREGKSKYGRLFTSYVRRTIPARQQKRSAYPVQHYSTYTDTDGEYEEEYKLWPPPVGMIIISLIEISTFVYDCSYRGYGYFDGPAATIFIYNPHRRKEVWRFLTYMFVHAGAEHLCVNLVVQIVLGLPLEMVHSWWRVLIVYFAGVIAGSLGTSVLDPHVYLAGASGGVYALIAAHLATIIMNWSEMEFAKFQLLIFLILCIGDTSSAVYYRYVKEVNNQIGYEAHLAGAIAGLLVGIYVLKNLEVLNWEKKIWWTALVIYILLMVAAIIINIFTNMY